MAEKEYFKIFEEDYLKKLLLITPEYELNRIYYDNATENWWVILNKTEVSNEHTTI